jgi:hypothetical protein
MLAPLRVDAQQVRNAATELERPVREALPRGTAVGSVREPPGGPGRTH